MRYVRYTQTLITSMVIPTLLTITHTANQNVQDAEITIWFRG